MVSKQLALLKSFIELFVIASFYFIVAAFKRIDYSLLTHNFGSHLSKMRPAGAFRFVTLFNLQGTRRLAEHLVLYKIHSSLSRTFFKFFQTFSFHLLHHRRSPDSLVIISDLPPFVNTFFRLFSKNHPRVFHAGDFFEKSRKKVLTKGRRSDIITKLSGERR